MIPSEVTQPLKPLKPFRWDRTKYRVAELLSAGELTDVEIAGQVGVAERTLRYWKRHPDFAGQVAALVAELGAVTQCYAVGKVARRLRWLDDRHARLQQIIRDRAADPSMQDVPGGSTGLMLRKTKGIGRGAHFQRVDDYRVDVALLRELRALERQAALEVKRWQEAQEHRVMGLGSTTTVPDGLAPVRAQVPWPGEEGVPVLDESTKDWIPEPAVR